MTNKFSAMDFGAQSFSGIRIIADPYLPKTRLEQFRFPRSKKVRIRKKWRKNPANWRDVDATGDIYWMDESALVAPELWEKLKARFMEPIR